MDNYIDPKMLAARDFHKTGKNQNPFIGGSMRHAQYEQEWWACFDHESEQVRSDLQLMGVSHG